MAPTASSVPRLVACLAALGLAAGCVAPPDPQYELVMRSGDLRCDAKKSMCVDANGLPVGGRYRRGRATVRRRGGPLEVFMLMGRPGSTQALLDMRLPLPGAPLSSAAGQPPKIRYYEAHLGRVLFRAKRISGRVEVGVDTSCPCQTGRFELLLRDPGPDGKLDTKDDRLRRISNGRLRRDRRPFCHRAQMLPVKPGLLVVGVRACPGRRRGPSLRLGFAWAWNGRRWLGDDDGWNDGDWYDSGWVPPYSDGWDDGWVDDYGDDGGGGGGVAPGSTGGGGDSGGGSDDDWSWGDSSGGGGSSGWGGDGSAGGDPGDGGWDDDGSWDDEADNPDDWGDSGWDDGDDGDDGDDWP